jgi:hypothetical protein
VRGLEGRGGPLGGEDSPNPNRRGDNGGEIEWRRALPFMGIYISLFLLLFGPLSRVLHGAGQSRTHQRQPGHEKSHGRHPGLPGLRRQTAFPSLGPSFPRSLPPSVPQPSLFTFCCDGELWGCAPRSTDVRVGSKEGGREGGRERGREGGRGRCTSILELREGKEGR